MHYEVVARIRTWLRGPPTCKGPECAIEEGRNVQLRKVGVCNLGRSECAIEEGSAAAVQLA
jgi:hypothetical protein